MEKKDKIIIIGLIIVIIALIAGLVYMFMGNNLSMGEGNVPEGMQEYNFDSAFTMAVPENSKFLKDFNFTLDGFDRGVMYFDRNNEISISYMDSPIITHGLVDSFANISGSSGNTTIEFEGDLMILHFLKNNGKVGKTSDESEFKEGILIQKGHEVVVINGNDGELIKSMAKTLEWCE